MFYKYTKALHQLKFLQIIKMFLYNLHTYKYFYLELRECPWLRGHFTLPNIELQFSSLLTIQVMHSVLEMMKHCLNKTDILGGFFCIISLSLCQEYLAFLFENFYYRYWEFQIMQPSHFPVFADPPLPLRPSLSRKRKETERKKKRNPYIQDGREDSGVESTCSCRDLSCVPDTNMETPRFQVTWCLF